MAILTAYVCDKCSAHFDSDDDIWKMAVAVSSHSSHRRESYDLLRADWCSTCVARAGFIKRDHMPVPAATITLEDLIREIAGDVVRERTGQV